MFQPGSPPPVPSRQQPDVADRCESCGRMFGRSESVRIVGRKLICGDCRKKLPPAAPAQTQQEVAAAPQQGTPSPGKGLCANCSRPLGKLVRPHLYNNFYLVCGECYVVLTRSSLSTSTNLIIIGGSVAAFVGVIAAVAANSGNPSALAPPMGIVILIVFVVGALLFLVGLIAKAVAIGTREAK